MGQGTSLLSPLFPNELLEQGFFFQFFWAHFSFYKKDMMIYVSEAPSPFLRVGLDQGKFSFPVCF
jgi:hypothetical protein